MGRGGCYTGFQTLPVSRLCILRDEVQCKTPQPGSSFAGHVKHLSQHSQAFLTTSANFETPVESWPCGPYRALVIAFWGAPEPGDFSSWLVCGSHKSLLALTSRERSYEWVPMQASTGMEAQPTFPLTEHLRSQEYLLVRVGDSTDSNYLSCLGSEPIDRDKQFFCPMEEQNTAFFISKGGLGECGF